MNCPNCGVTLPDGSRFCGACGKAIPAQAASPAPEPQRQPLGGYRQPEAYRQPAEEQNSQQLYGQPQYGQTPGGTTPPPTNDGVVGGALSDGWATFKQNPGLYIGIFLVYAIVQNVVERLWGNESIIFKLGFGGSYGGTRIPLESLTAEKFLEMLQESLKALPFGFVISVVEIALLTGFMFAALKSMRGEKPRFSDFFAAFSSIITIFIAFLLYELACLAGFILLIIPGIIAAMGFIQFPLLIVDRKLGILKSLGVSWLIMRGQKRWLLVMGFVYIGITIAGLLAFIIGVIVAFPLILVMHAAFYKRVLEAYERANGPIG